MLMEKKEARLVIREGYQILLRAESELLLPKGKEKIAWFYEKISETCMNWAQSVHGERLRREYLAMEDTRERSQFRTQRYRLSMRCPWEEGKWMVLLCESTLTGQWKNPQKSYHRISHVWNVEEELLLPHAQILQTFGIKLEKNQLPFRPDGIYPEGNEMIFFRNADENKHFLENSILRNTEREC